MSSHTREDLQEFEQAESAVQQKTPGESLFPHLGAEQYRTRVLRYVYILLRLCFLGLILVGFWWVGGLLGLLLIPLLGSVILAYLLDPIVDRIEAWGTNRRAAILICLGTVVLLMALALFFIVPTMITQIGALIGQIPELITRIQDVWIPWILEQIRTQLPPSAQGSIQKSISSITTSLPSLARRVGGWGLGAVSTTGQALFILFNLILIPLFTYYFLRKLDPFKAAAANWVPRRRRDYTLSLLERMDAAIGQWFRGQLLVATIVGGLYAAGLAIVFGLFGIDFKLGVAIGIASGITNVIPYFGMILAILLTTLVVLLNWPGGWGVLCVVGVFVINHILEAYVVTPRVIGRQVGMNPIAVIILLLIGGELAGIWGILLIVPIAGAIKVIIPDLGAIYRETVFYQGHEIDQDSIADTSTPNDRS